MLIQNKKFEISTSRKGSTFKLGFHNLEDRTLTVFIKLGGEDAEHDNPLYKQGEIVVFPKRRKTTNFLFEKEKEIFIQVTKDGEKEPLFKKDVKL